MEMTYIEQIIDESMRLNPPVATLHRTATKDYMLPNGATITAGTKIIVPTLAFQRDENFFPNPLKFDPERFDSEMKKTRHPFASLPFGEGPRYCIGMRFGYLQTKLTIAMLLHNFHIIPCKRTENPVMIDPVTLVHGPAGGVWLELRSLKDRA
jgi:cytochrome P450 family 6